MQKRQKLWYYLSLVAGALILILPAFVNGYPLVNSDTSTYISSGFTPDAPWDRPITYGLLVYIFSFFGVSLWLSVFMQGYIVSWLVSLTLKRITGTWQPIIFICLMAFLALFTGLSWVTSQLIADVYTGIVAVCMYLLMSGGQSRVNTTLLYTLYFAAVATHTSHFVSCLAALLMLLMIRRWAFPGIAEKAFRRPVFIMLLLTVSTLGIMSACIAKSKAMFAMASFLDKGILQPALQDFCTDTTYNICKYKDNLPDANAFMWDADGPTLMEGGWRVTQKEYQHIVNRIYTTPRYLWMYIKQSAYFSLLQIGSFRIGDGNTPFPHGSNVAETIKTYMPGEHSQFLAAKQNKSDITDDLGLPNLIFYITVILSVLVLIYTIISNRQYLPGVFFHALVVFSVCILVNAWACGTFSQVVGRYGDRIIWLVPMMAVIALMSIFRGKRL